MSTPIAFDVNPPDYLVTTVANFQARTDRQYNQAVVDFHAQCDVWLPNAQEAVASGKPIPKAPDIPVRTIWGIKDGALVSYTTQDPTLVVPVIQPPNTAPSTNDIANPAVAPPDPVAAILAGVKDIQARLAKAGM